MEISKQTAGKKSQKMMWTAIALAVLAPLILWYELEHYYAHSDVGSLSEMISMAGIGVGVWMLYTNIKAAVKKETHKLGWAAVGCAALAIAVCIAVYSVAVRIPHCVECDHITTEELGFLSHWISGMDMP